MKQSISFSITPIANGLIVATNSDYGDYEQFYFATQVEAIEALPVVVAEAIARQEQREENEADVNAKHSAYAQQQRGINMDMRSVLGETAMTVGKPQVFNDAQPAD